MLSLPEVRLYRGCGMDFTTPVGGSAGGEWVSSLAVCVLAVGWGLGREQCVGETQESCSTTVAGIFKRPSPALGDMSVSNRHGASPILGLLRQLLLGVPTSNTWGRAQCFPSGTF